MTRAIISDEQRAAMVEAYKNGASLTEAAALFGYTKKATEVSLRKAGVPSRAVKLPAKVSDEQRAAMVEAYKNGATIEGAAALFGLSRKAAKVSLQKAGVAGCHSGRLPGHTYSKNHDFFAAVDTEEKAYWLGFFVADGCNHGKSISVHIQLPDVAHLEKLRAALECGNPIEHWGESVALRVYSEKLASDLCAVGATPRKSLTAQPWNGPEHLMPHYWRGLVDGDGSVSAKKYKEYVHLCGSLDVVTGFKEWARDISGSVAKVNKVGNLHNVSFNGRLCCRAIMEALYGEATVSLDRKKLVADTILATSKSYTRTPKVR